MMGGRMMLGKVVGTVRLAFAPVNLKLALADTIADPVKSHINCFGSFLFDGVSGDAAGSVVVGGHGRCGLLVPHFFKGNAEVDTLPCHCGTRAPSSASAALDKHFAHDVTHDVDGAVGFERGMTE
jgi:hypothetical protein